MELGFGISSAANYKGGKSRASGWLASWLIAEIETYPDVVSGSIFGARRAQFGGA